MRFGIGATSGMRPKLLRMRFLPVNDLAMASPQSNPNCSMPGDKLRRGAVLKDDKSQKVRTSRTPAFRP
jgi:hypothetical protein